MDILNSTLMKSARHARGHHFVEVPAAHDIRAVMSPTYWVNCGVSLRLNDLIEFRYEDGEYEGLIRITAIRESAVHFDVLYLLQPMSASQALESIGIDVGSVEQTASLSTDNIEVKWGGQKEKFRILHGDKVAVLDGEELTKIGSRKDAEAYLALYIESLQQEEAA